MITKSEISALLQSTETYRVEKTISTSNMDKFCEAICAFANDLPDSRQKGYLFIGANDTRDIKEQLASIRIYDRKHDRPGKIENGD